MRLVFHSRNQLWQRLQDRVIGRLLSASKFWLGVHLKLFDKLFRYWTTFSSGRIEPVRPVRGTRDRFGTENVKYNYILKIATSIAELHCYNHVSFGQSDQSGISF